MMGISPFYPKAGAGWMAGPGQMGAYPAVGSYSAMGAYSNGGPASAQPVSYAAPPTAARQPREESYIENILRLNLGKMATIYMTYENNPDWPAKVYRGRLEAAGRDHIIISDPATGMRYLLLMVNLDYITFDEELQYLTPPAVR